MNQAWWESGARAGPLVHVRLHVAVYFREGTRWDEKENLHFITKCFVLGQSAEKLCR